MDATPLRRLTIDALGTPVPQGSKIPVRRGGKLLVVDDNAHELKAWRAVIATAARARMALTGWVTLDAACLVTMTLWFRRPASVTRPYPSVRPDLDKLERAVLDALSTDTKVLADDARVVDMRSRKRYAAADGPVGVHIVIEPMDPVLL